MALQSEWRILSAGFQADGLTAVSVDQAAGADRLRHLDVPDAFCKRSAGTHHSPGRHINRTECLPADQFSVCICDRGRILDCFHSLKHVPVLRWVICIVLAFVWTYIDDKIITPFTSSQHDLWPVKVYADFDFHYTKLTGWTVELTAVHISLFSFLAVIVLAALCLALASMPLNRKVEV